MCGYFTITLVIFCSKPMFNFHKGTYVIKTLYKLVQKLTRIILPDADITIASLNSDLALDFIFFYYYYYYYYYYFIYFFFFAGRQIYQMCAR